MSNKSLMDAVGGNWRKKQLSRGESSKTRRHTRLPLILTRATRHFWELGFSGGSLLRRLCCRADGRWVSQKQEKCKSLIWPTVLRSPRMNWPRLTLWYFSWQHTWGCVWQMKETFQPDDPVSPCFGPSVTLAVNDQSVLQPRWRS